MLLGSSYFFKRSFFRRLEKIPDKIWYQTCIHAVSMPPPDSTDKVPQVINRHRASRHLYADSPRRTSTTDQKNQLEKNNPKFDDRFIKSHRLCESHNVICSLEIDFILLPRKHAWSTKKFLWCGNCQMFRVKWDLLWLQTLKHFFNTANWLDSPNRRVSEYTRKSA